jgi:16S rRNA U516 pseudouridylate synthase RsuA-like enzyme
MKTTHPPVTKQQTASTTTIPLFQSLQSSHGITRREFVDMIKHKAIKHGDVVVTDIGYQVNIGDRISITLEDKSQIDIAISALRHKKSVMVVFNKPTGYVVSKEDPHNKTIFELLPESRRQDFYPIGRLDKDSRGLLLLTNQPSLVDQYLHPRHQLLKIYEVKTDKPVS